MSYDNTNRIAIFKNENAKENQPQYRGTVNVNGKDFEVSLWVKETQHGKKYFSGQIQEPRQKDTLSVPDNKTPGSIPNNEDDTLPF